MDKTRAAIVYQIDAERGRQENLWGSGFDERNTPNDWATIVTHYMSQAAMCSQRWTGVRPDCRVVLNVQDYRKNLVKAAAVCIAAIEAIDRTVDAPGKRHYDDDGLSLKMVQIPEWGVHVWVHERSAAGAGQFNSGNADDTPTQVMLRSIAACTYDDAGEPIFTTKEHMKALGEKNIELVRRLHSAVLDLNGLTSDAAEEASKNSDAAPSDSSSSD